MNQQMLLLIVPITYLVGSIPVGLIIGKVKSGIDIRKHEANLPELRMH